MNNSESKYFNTARKMDEALLELLNDKDLEYITVKEICTRAGVNRSTFYLHYNDIGELLDETGECISEKFASYFKKYEVEEIEEPESLKDEDLNFIKPEYLTPWLSFIRDNKRLFQTIMRIRHKLPPIHYEMLVEKAVDSATDRLIPNREDREYIFSYYMGGVMSIVEQWMKNGCRDSIERITSLIVKCVNG